MGDMPPDEFPEFRIKLCTGWISVFFTEFLVLGEDRAANYQDFERFFIFMDDSGI